MDTGTTIDVEALKRAIETGEADGLNERGLVSIEIPLGDTRALLKLVKQQPWILLRSRGAGADHAYPACFTCPCLIGCTLYAGSLQCNTQRVEHSLVTI